VHSSQLNSAPSLTSTDVWSALISTQEFMPLVERLAERGLIPDEIIPFLSSVHQSSIIEKKSASFPIEVNSFLLQQEENNFENEQSHDGELRRINKHLLCAEAILKSGANEKDLRFQ